MKKIKAINKFIYLDWNAIKYLKHHKDEEFYKIIEELKKTYMVPFSYTHLYDLQKNANEENKHFIDEDISFLSDLSNDILLDVHDDNIKIETNSSPKNAFLEIKKAKEDLYPQNLLPQDIIEEILRIGIKNFFSKDDNYQKYHRQYIEAVFNRFDSESKLYKQFINECSLPNNFSPTKWKDIINGILKEQEKKYLTSTLMYAYLYLELHPQFKDKITKKNTYSNIYTDQEHFINSIYAKYFITEDKHMLKKVQFLYDAYNIDTKIYNINDFVSAYNSNNL